MRELEINEYPSEKCFATCTCCGRTKVGVPCPCFFSIAQSANIAQKEIMNVGMFDVRYLKVSNADYGCDDEVLANMLYAAQEVTSPFDITFCFIFISVLCLITYTICLYLDLQYI